MISFGIKYWFIILLAIVIASIGVTGLLYYKNKALKELSKIQVRVLILLRFLSCLLVSILLLSPFIRNQKKITQNPLIITAWDNSRSSVSSTDSLEAAAEILAVREKINNQLGSDFEIIEYAFGQETRTNASFSFSDKESNYSKLISSVVNNHFNQNIGALILTGDGIYNRGKNPLNTLNEVKFPIYTIGIGDTAIIADCAIKNVKVNRTAFSGNKFPAEVDVQILKAKGKKLKLSIFHENTELESFIVTPGSDNYFYTHEFILEAEKPGLKHYTARIETLNNERNTANNSTPFVINVLESKQKILILSNGVHPDIGAIKNTLEQQKTYDVSVFTEDPFPEDLKTFNLIILNQLPSRSKSVSEIIEKARNSRIPVLFIVGNKTFLPQLNALSQGVKVTPLAGLQEESQATFNSLYSSFSVSEELLTIIPQFPPVQVPFANYELDTDFSPLLYQKLKNIETGKPLIATGTFNGRKIGYIFGEGIWRWRLFEYYQHQTHTRFNELVNQLVQYLALRENEDNFIVSYKPVYAETEDVIFKAELYNDAFERISSEEINITLKNHNEDEFAFTFDVQGDDYFLHAGHLPTGDYTFSATATIGKKEYNKTGSFTIIPVNIENINTRANHNLLFQLATNSGGKFHHPQNTEQLIEELKSSNKLKTTTYYQEMINQLLNLRLLFFVIVLLLGMEWFLRKYWGIY